MKSNVKCKLLNVRKAFSLIEVLITVSIIGIMSSAIFISMRDSKTEKELETAAQEVVATIREAQNNALTGKNFGCERIYYMQFNTAENESLYFNRVIGTGSNCPSSPIQNYILKNGVIFKTENTFYFSVPFGTLHPPYGVKIQLEKNGKYYYVCITPSGNITEQKNACP